MPRKQRFKPSRKPKIDNPSTTERPTSPADRSDDKRSNPMRPPGDAPVTSPAIGRPDSDGAI